jgi:hypothetical protein
MKAAAPQDSVREIMHQIRRLMQASELSTKEFKRPLKQSEAGLRN